MNEIDIKPAVIKEELTGDDKKRNTCPTCKKVVIGTTYKFNCHIYKHGAIAARHFCPHCPREFYRHDKFQHHLSTHTGEYKNLFLCDFCNRTFVDKRNLYKHLKVHDESFTEHSKVKTFPCRACNNTYTEERVLKHHVRRVHNSTELKEPKFVKKPINDTWVERVLDSNVCVQVTKLNDNAMVIKKCDVSATSDLNKYFQRYRETSASQYSKAICDYCNKEMIKKSLRLHIKEKHMTVGTFKCKVCKNAYNRHYQLVNHVCGQPRNKRRKKSKKV